MEEQAGAPLPPPAAPVILPGKKRQREAFVLRALFPRPDKVRLCTRKRAAATAGCREGACSRTGEPGVPFCGKGGMAERYEKSPARDRAF